MPVVPRSGTRVRPELDGVDVRKGRVRPAWHDRFVAPVPMSGVASPARCASSCPGRCALGRMPYRGCRHPRTTARHHAHQGRPCEGIEAAGCRAGPGERRRPEVASPPASCPELRRSEVTDPPLPASLQGAGAFTLRGVRPGEAASRRPRDEPAGARRCPAGRVSKAHLPGLGCERFRLSSAGPIARDRWTVVSGPR